MGSLQQIVDHMSDALRQPVLIDDAAFRPLAYSAHVLDDADGVRVDSILTRTTRPEVVEWLHGEGVAQADGPVRLRGGEELGLSSRWCAPIRSHDCLLGFAWVIAEHDLRPDEQLQLQRLAEAAAYAIEHERNAGSEPTMHQALRQLLCAEPPEAYAAAAQLVGSGVMSAEQRVAVLVATVGDGGMDDTSRVLAGLGTQLFAGVLRGRRVLHAVWEDRAVCLVAGSDADALARDMPAYAQKLHASLARAWDGRHEPTIGVGGTADALAGARRSYEQATWAAQVAARLADEGPVLCWDDLGVFQLLSALEDVGAALPAELRALLACPNHDMLLETLEVYLDTGGDAQATAARLCLARGSLYYRLRRIEELADVDLRDGCQRLTLHLGLKLARLGGRWSGAHHAPLEPVAQLAG